MGYNRDKVILTQRLVKYHSSSLTRKSPIKITKIASATPHASARISSTGHGFAPARPSPDSENAPGPQSIGTPSPKCPISAIWNRMPKAFTRCIFLRCSRTSATRNEWRGWPSAGSRIGSTLAWKMGFIPIISVKISIGLLFSPNPDCSHAP